MSKDKSFVSSAADEVGSLVTGGVEEGASIATGIVEEIASFFSLGSSSSSTKDTETEYECTRKEKK